MSKNILRIKCFSSFCDSKICKDNFENIVEPILLEKYKSNHICFTTDEDYTHVIILNTAMPAINSNVPKENVLGLAYEPIEFLNITQEFVEYAKKYIGKYFIGSKHNLPEPFIERFAFMWFCPPIRYENPYDKAFEKTLIKTSVKPFDKTKVMSIVLSDKISAPGHRYRHVLVENILKNNLPIDIYGKGANRYLNIGGSSVKGEFKDIEPYRDYCFTICIENYRSNDYISEKFMNPIMNHCMPIYIGAKNVSNYFNHFISLTGDLKTDIHILINILQEPKKYYKNPYSERNICQMNIFEHVRELF
jgi:hypothetical protein